MGFYKKKWTPSKAQRAEFKEQMAKIDEFCAANNISQSASSDSYYFTINNKKYRVSNHSIEASNSKAYNHLGEKVRDKYHPDKREDDVIYIHASKTRIIEIYNALKAGHELDGKGNIKRLNKEAEHER